MLNRWAEGTPIRVRVPLTKLGIDHMGGYSARDVFEGTSMGVMSPDDVLQVDVNPTGQQTDKASLLLYLSERMSVCLFVTAPKAKMLRGNSPY